MSTDSPSAESGNSFRESPIRSWRTSPLGETSSSNRALPLPPTSALLGLGALDIGAVQAELLADDPEAVLDLGDTRRAAGGVPFEAGHDDVVQRAGYVRVDLAGRGRPAAADPPQGLRAHLRHPEVGVLAGEQ